MEENSQEENQEIDIDLTVELSKYDQEVGQRGDQARDLLYKFDKNPNNFRYAIQILEATQTPVQIRVHAIGSLKTLVLEHWGDISDEEREQYRNFIVEFVFKYGSEKIIESPVLLGGDLALVGLLIQEWPENFTNIFEMFIEKAQANEFACGHYIQMIRLFCQQVIESNEDQLTYSQKLKLINCLQDQAENIYKFLETVLTGTDDSDLIKIGLSTLKYFIKWINPKEIIETKVFEALCNTFLPQSDYAVQVLDLLYEIFGNPQLPDEFSSIVNQIFNMTVQAVDSYISGIPNFDFAAQQNDHFSQILPMTLTVFLEKDKFVRFIEIADNVEVIQTALKWLLELTNVGDLEVLHTCCNFWLIISRRCHKEQLSNQQQQTALTEIYAPVLPYVRRSLIEKMQRPDDIIIYEDASGMIKKESQKNTQTQMIYSIMKECLALLTSLDPDDTIDAIQTDINLLMSDWSPEIYDRVCWSVGAISRTLDFDKEKTFITQLIRIQLSMSQSAQDPNERAIIAAGIMHICSQYPRFLQKFQNFLRTVVGKLFDFMHQQDVVGVQDMAVTSFKKIAEGCKRSFCVVPKGSNDPPFIVEIIQKYPEYICDLDTELIITFFDALTIVVASETEKDKNEQLELLLQPLNEQWKDCMDNFNPADIDIIKKIAFVLSCNAIIAFNMRLNFYDQFMTIFPQMMMVYSSIAEFQSKNLESRSITQDANKLYLNAKSSVIRVIKDFVSRTINPASNLQDIIPNLVETIFDEYGASSPDARTPEVLNLLSVLFKQMQESINPFLNQILDAIFASSVEMISADYTTKPEFRLPLYELLEQLVNYYLAQLISVPEGFDQVIRTIQWGYKHPMHEVCEKSLGIVQNLLKKIRDTNEQKYGEFLENYYLELVSDMFSIMTDTIHKFAIDKNIEILRDLLKISDVQLNPETITNVVVEHFPNREGQVVFEFITELIRTSNNKVVFNQTIKDFLVTTRQFLPQDPDLEKDKINAQIEDNNNYMRENVYRADPEIRDEDIDFLD